MFRILLHACVLALPVSICLMAAPIQISTTRMFAATDTAGPLVSPNGK
jgi:hypothetical protein